MPRRPQSYCQNAEVKRGSRSCKTDRGTPKRDTTLEKNKSATCDALSSPSPMVHGVSTTYLLSLSTHVKMALKPCDAGKSVMKSMVQVSNRDRGTSTGWCSPGARVVRSFAFRQISQLPHSLRTSSARDGHQTRWDNKAMVRRVPKWDKE